MNPIKFLFPILLLACITLAAPIRVAFLPFEDKVQFKYGWKLGEDIPRWFSHTVDTLGIRDSAFVLVALDSALLVIRQNNISTKSLTSLETQQRIASRLNADYLCVGTIKKFFIIKQSLHTKAPIDGSLQITSSATGQGGVTIVAGLGSYTAEISLSCRIIEGATGRVLDEVVLDTKERDVSFASWLTFQSDNPESDFARMQDEPFGSIWFQRSVVGIVMKQFSSTLNRRIHDCMRASKPATAIIDKAYLEGHILERNNDDVYIDLGSANNLLQSEQFDVYAKDHPLLGSNGDTLGYAEKKIGRIEVRFIKAAHFSLCRVLTEHDSLRAGQSVRPISSQK